jgi:hypothetical protein
MSQAMKDGSVVTVEKVMALMETMKGNDDA